MAHNRGTHLEGRYCKGVNIALCRGAVDRRKGILWETFRREAFRGHIPKCFWLVVVARETSERARNPKVCEARLAIPTDQDVVLDVPNVNMGTDCSFVFAH